MGMIRAIRMLNDVNSGAMSGSQLQTALADPGHLGEWLQMLTMRGQMRNMAASSTAMTAVIASSTAMTAVAASSTAMTAIYASPTAVLALYPTAFAVYAPHAALLSLSGSNVTQWTDATGHAHNMVQATVAQQPLFNGTAANGYTTVNFDGSDDCLVAPSYAMPADLTVYVVRRKASTGTCGLLGTNTTNDAGGILEGNGPAYIDYSGVAGSYPLSLATAPTTWELLRFRNTGTTTWGKKNAGGEVSVAANMLFGSVSLSLGYASDPDQFNDVYLSGQIAEVVILGKNAADGDAEGDRVTNLLRNKYAIW